MKLLIRSLVSLLALAAAAVAQTPTSAQTAALLPLATPAPSTDVTLALAWTDTSKAVQIAITNSGATPLQILGVQSTSGLFVVDYPRTVPPKGSANLSAIYEARPGSDSEVELVRLKTADGERVVRVTLAREPVVTLETKQLRWTVGEAATPKSVLVAVDRGVTIRAVNAARGATATVQAVNATTYRVVVTPASTARAASFPVALALSPSAPGVTPFITCTVENN